MAKSKLIEQSAELDKQDLEKVENALVEKDVHSVPSSKDAHLYKTSLNEQKEIVETPGHTTRAFRN